MCGITGIYRFSGSGFFKDLEAMNATLFPRGPDGEGKYIDNFIALAMRRLAIIDLAGGDQPLYNEDRSLVLIINGEIYNYLTLREFLLKKGHQFRTNVDGEVILHLYEEYGVEALKHLNGMFAFALWDIRQKKLWLARDRLGIKPLYYTIFRNQFYFSSSLEAFSKIQEFSCQPTKEAIFSYYINGYVPAPKTLYNNIFKVMPGHYLLLDQDGLKQVTYWDPENFISDEQHLQMDVLHDLLLDSVKKRCLSEVSVATTLSGGIDSSLVTVLSKKQANLSTAYSVDFLGKDSEDFEFAQFLSKQHGINLRSILLTKTILETHFKSIVSTMDEPLSDSAYFPNFLIAQLARADNVKVLLSGAGADEIFGGYRRYYDESFSDRLSGKGNFLPKSFLFFLSRYLPKLFSHRFALLYNDNIRYANGISGISIIPLLRCLPESGDQNLLLDLLDAHYISLRKTRKNYGYQKSRMLHDLKNYLPNNILALTDKSSMANSIEMRVPFLDHRLVEYLYAIDPKQLLSTSSRDYKRALRDYAKNHLPSSIVSRKKSGFNAPIQDWFSAPSLLPFEDTKINRFLSEEMGFFNVSALNKLLQLKTPHLIHRHFLYATQVLLTFFKQHRIDAC